MLILVNHKRIRTVTSTLSDGTVTYFYPINLFVGWCNPFTTKVLKKPFFSKIPAGGFHFFGLRVTLMRGGELTDKRIVKPEFYTNRK